MFFCLAIQDTPENLTNLPGTSFRLPDARRRAKVPAEARLPLMSFLLVLMRITTVLMVIVVVIVVVVLPY